MGLSTNKILIITPTLFPPMLLFCYWVQSHFEKASTTTSISREQPNQRIKFFTWLSTNNSLKVVFVDNDNIESIQDLTKETRKSNSSNNKSEDIEGSSYNNGSYSLTDKKRSNGIEWDETIDYNYSENVGTTRKTCSKEDPSKTIVLVQPRYSAHEPFTNIMYKYGDLNHLTFALPKRSTFESYWPLRFHPSFIDSSLIFATRVNMLINPPYCYSTIKRYMSKDAVFIAVIYDPVNVYLSNLVGTSSLRKDKPKTSLKNLNQTGKITEDQYENSMASDLGYPIKRLGKSNLEAKQFINELETQFDLVLIGDYLDESLLVLKKVLCWSLKDLIFLSQREENLHKNIPNHLKLMIKARNKIDQAIYEHFNQTLWEKVRSYGPEFVSDLEELQRLRTKMNGDCSIKAITSQGVRNLELREKTEHIETLCKKLKWSEHEYISYLKRRPSWSGDDELMKGLKYLEQSLYTFINTTSKEILKLKLL